MSTAPERRDFIFKGGWKVYGLSEGGIKGSCGGFLKAQVEKVGDSEGAKMLKLPTKQKSQHGF